jgi:hypothetical protein
LVFLHFNSNGAQFYHEGIVKSRSIAIQAPSQHDWSIVCNTFIFVFVNIVDAPPSSLLGPKRVQLCQRAEVVGTWCHSQLLALERVEGACWGSKIRLGRGKSYSLIRTCIKPTNKLVNSHFGTPLVLGQATSNFELTWLTTARTRGKPPPSPI